MINRCIYIPSMEYYAAQTLHKDLKNIGDDTIDEIKYNWC